MVNRRSGRAPFYVETVISRLRGLAPIRTSGIVCFKSTADDSAFCYIDRSLHSLRAVQHPPHDSQSVRYTVMHFWQVQNTKMGAHVCLLIDAW